MLSLRYEATVVTGLGKAVCAALATLKIQILNKFDIHYIIMSISLNFVLNMTEAGSFETSLICYRSTRIRSTAAIYDK